MIRADIEEPQLFVLGGRERALSRITVAGQARDLSFVTEKGPLAANLDPYLPATLLSAMKAAAPVHLHGSVSPKLLRSTDEIQQIFRTWDPTFSPIPITAEETSIPALHPDRGVGCFFSGGLDSFYTILKHLDEIDQLVTVHGLAIRLADRDVQAQVSRSLQEAAAELGKPLIEVETNIHDVTDRAVGWTFQHGPAMASVALLLSPLFHKMYLAATHTYPYLRPWGSHPLLDPLWSNEAVEIVHDGCEATRDEKAALVATSDTALHHLRVCFGYRESYAKGIVNCGHCEKCLRTKISLYLVGALHRCTTLDQTLDLQAISQMPLPNEGYRRYARDSLELAMNLHADPALISALREALVSSEQRGRSVVRGFRAELQRLQDENQTLTATAQAFQHSRSWRIMAPFRAFSGTRRRLRGWLARFSHRHYGPPLEFHRPSTASEDGVSSRTSHE